MKKTLSVVLFSMFFLVLICSCKTNTGKTNANTDSLPDMVLENATYTFGRPEDEQAITFTAKSVKMYPNGTKTTLESVDFRQGDEIQGSCDFITVTQSNTMAQLEGNVFLEKKSDNMSIRCNNLIWDDSKHTLKSTGGIDVTYEDGTRIKAEAFSAQLDNNIYEFTDISEGSITEK